MHPTVYRVATVLCAVVAGVPVGTNWGLVLVFWMLLSGLFGAWVYFGARPPELGYYGFFYVFELVGSLFYFGALVCVLASLALIGFVIRRGMATTAQHGFEVHTIAGKDAA